MSKQKKKGHLPTPKANGSKIKRTPIRNNCTKIKSTKSSPFIDPEREGRIAERRLQIPKIHRSNYDRAMKGKSMKAAIKAFCLECVCWQKEEVRLCTSLTCPLYPYRPYRSSNRCSERLSFGAELKRLDKGDK